MQHVRRLAHVLHASREDGARATELDVLRRGRDRLDARATQAVDRQRRHVVRHSSFQRDVARAVDRVVRGLQCIADHGVVDRSGRDLGALQRRLRGVCAEVDRGELLELAEAGGAGVLGHRGACSADDDDVLSHMARFLE